MSSWLDMAVTLLNLGATLCALNTNHERRVLQRFWNEQAVSPSLLLPSAETHKRIEEGREQDSCFTTGAWFLAILGVVIQLSKTEKQAA